MTERPFESPATSPESPHANEALPDTRDLDEFDIVHSESNPLDIRKRRPSLILLVGAVVVVAAAIWLVVSRPTAPPAASGTDAVVNQPTAGTTDRTLGGAPSDVTVPALDQSDALVRQLVQQLTSHPAVAAWLSTTGLIRNFTVVVANIADRMTPSRHLRALRPGGAFATTTNGNRLVIDQSTYHRFDGVAAAAASIDAQGAARLYATLKPRIEEAYRDLGHPDTSVDRAIEAAIVELLRTPIVDGPIPVSPGSKGIGFVYTNADLEALTPPQKQLLRMGPDNARTIQRSLRSIALALGIPADHLPQETHARAS